jgi:hypothetical protein
LFRFAQITIWRCMNWQRTEKEKYGNVSDDIMVNDKTLNFLMTSCSYPPPPPRWPLIIDFTYLLFVCIIHENSASRQYLTDQPSANFYKQNPNPLLNRFVLFFLYILSVTTYKQRITTPEFTQVTNKIIRGHFVNKLLVTVPLCQINSRRPGCIVRLAKLVSEMLFNGLRQWGDLIYIQIVLESFHIMLWQSMN